MPTISVPPRSHRSTALRTFTAVGLVAAVFIAACNQAPAAPTAQPAVQPTAAKPTAVPVAQPTMAPTVAPEPTATAPVLSEEAIMDAVRKAWETMAAAGPRKVVQTSKDADGTGVTIEAVFVPPDSIDLIENRVRLRYA